MDHLSPEKIAILSAQIQEARRQRRRKAVWYMKLIRVGMLMLALRVLYILYNLFFK